MGGGSAGMMDGNAATNFLLQALMSNGGNNAALISQLLSSGGPAASMLLQNIMQQPFTQQSFPMGPKNVSPYWYNQSMNNKVINVFNEIQYYKKAIFEYFKYYKLHFIYWLL